MFSASVVKIVLAGSFDTDRIVVALDGSSPGAITDILGNKLAGTFSDNGTLPSQLGCVL